MIKELIIGAPDSVPKLADVVQVAKDGGADWMAASGARHQGAQEEGEEERLPGAKISIHPEAIERLKQEAAEQPESDMLQPDEIDAQLPAPDDSAPYMTEMQTRSIMFVRLLTIVNGRTNVRYKVVERLMELLNRTHHLRIRASGRDESVLAEIVRLIVHDGNGHRLPITRKERDCLMAGQIPTVGLGAMAVVAARGIQEIALAICALSCETIQADTGDIDEDKVEAVCSSEAVQVALRLQDLLNGSVRVNPNNNGGTAPHCISMVPAVNGELEAAIRRCEQSVTVAMRSIPTDPDLVFRLGPAIGLPIALLYLSTLLVRAAELSLGRTEKVAESLKDRDWLPQQLRSAQNFLRQATQLRGAAQQVMAAEVGKACFAGALAAWAGVTALLNALALESAVLLLSLREQKIPLKDGPLMVGEPGGSAATVQQRQRGKDGGPSLGFGTARFRILLEAAVTDFRHIRQVVEHISAMGGTTGISEPQLRLQALLAALDPIGDQLPREMAEVQHIVQSHAKVVNPKLPKGTLDLQPDQMVIRDKAFATLVGIFLRHGSVALDTPSFELREMFTGRYGVASDSLFELKDEGGERLSLRYDLKVPFARYMSQQNVSNMKRYQIGRVFRKEEPHTDTKRGVFREFYQIDFDIAGNCPPMVADAEVLKVLVELLEQLEIGDFEIKLNHRLLINGILRLCDIPTHKSGLVYAALDRWAGQPWDKVKAELVENHGIDSGAVDRIGRFISRQGKPGEVVEQLREQEPELVAYDSCNTALKELEVLFKLLQVMGVLHRFVFSMRIPGSLHFYTGLVFEAFQTETDNGTPELAIAAGGRYDNLIGSFGEKQTRAVGLSVAFERVLPLLERRYKDGATNKLPKQRETKTEVLVMSVGKEMQPERMKLASELWGLSIGAEFTYSKANPFMPEQVNYATTSGIPLAVLLAPRELREGVVELMETATGQRGFVPRSQVVAIIKERLQMMSASGLSITTSYQPSQQQQ